jgi:hypothetical protein
MAMYLGTNRVAVTNSSGGSSDFSVAHLTVTSTENTLDLVSVFINDGALEYEGINVFENTTEVLDIVLYDGLATMWVDAMEITSISGSITQPEPYYFEVTGDATLVGKGWGSE